MKQACPDCHEYFDGPEVLGESCGKCSYMPVDLDPKALKAAHEAYLKATLTHTMKPAVNAAIRTYLKGIAP